MKKIKIALRFVLLSCGFCLLAGCAGLSQNPSGQQARLSANDYLQLAASNQGTEKQTYLLKAADRLIQDRQLSQAESILDATQRTLPPQLMTMKQLIGVKLFIAYRQNHDALSLLESMSRDRSAWTRDNQITWHQLAAVAYAKTGNLAASIQQRSEVTPLLKSNAERKQNLMETWDSLQGLPLKTLQNTLSQTTSPAVRGWLSLAAITDQSNSSNQQLMTALQAWETQFPKHPASALLPSSLHKLNSALDQTPQHIFLLLPLSGRYAKAGEAIRNGFFAAYYQEKHNGKATPTISVINTADKKIEVVYQDALQKGADFVVGPLVKTQIEALARSKSLKVPTLALNTLPNNRQHRINNLYQFGLSPVDEAVQAARKAWNAHHGRALVITPKNNWGAQISQAFSNEFTRLGGTIVGTARFTSQKTLSVTIRDALNIDQATWREAALKHILREKMRFIPRRRKDVDMVFLVAQPNMARQIRPLLRFYYAGRIPVYATSAIFNGTPNPGRDHDLNGILFCDMPWVLTASNWRLPQNLQSIRQHIQSTWPTAYRHQPKLFALGVDAYDIIPKLNKMISLPQFGTRGATGTLYLTKDLHIYRQLIWSQIVSGTPRTL